MTTGIGYYAIGVFGIGDADFAMPADIPTVSDGYTRDIQHTFGGDLTLSATGDIALSAGTQLSQERVLRRLLTIPGAYIWHLNYGAGLPRFVGEVADKLRIAAVAKAQMFREATVARTPTPQITVTVSPNSIVNLGIQYSDAASKAPALLNFPLNG